MALEGTFSDFGLAEIFQLIGLQKKTGVLTVRSGTEKQVVTVSFDSGMVTFADEYQRSENERLGSILLRAELITKEALARAVETQKETLQRLGHVLIQTGFITQEELRRALQTQVKETVYRLFRWKEGSYHFSSEPVTYDKEMYHPVSAEFLLMEGVRMIDEWPIIEKKITSFDIVYERVPGKEVSVAEASGEKEGQGDLDDLINLGGEETPPPAQRHSGAPGGGSSLSPQERMIYDLIDGERSVQELVDVGKAGEFETCKILYSFLSIGLIRPAHEAALAQPARNLAGHRIFPIMDYLMVALLTVLLFAALLFNPWSYFALNYNVQQSRKEIGALRDDMRIERLHYALQVFYLEKQDYPFSLDKLREDKILRGRDIRDHQGRPFVYRGGEEGYNLSRKSAFPPEEGR